ncbi:MAG TPA: heavy-metal-associated domain-containing protein [Phycisphaerales bacterium]|nr:heavy-metal-associated domain-containing protein [Phycisphaerales bacterium]
MRASILITSALLVPALLSACAGHGTASTAVGQAPTVHAYTAQDKAYLSSTVPVRADRVLLYVHGVGCPLCASGVDTAIMRLPGVTSSSLNLATNTVMVAMSGPDRPTPAQFNRAVALDFTLVKIEELR